MKNIFIIRHGETDHNLRGIVQGSGIDAPLNAHGRAQAQKFYECYKEIGFDKIYVSTLRRTEQTVMPFIEQGIPYEKHAGLNEICWGKFEGQRIDNWEHKPYFTALMQNWREGAVHLSIDGGESPMQVAARQEPFIKLMFEREDEENVLICMHGRAMRIFLCQLLKIPMHKMEVFVHSNLSLYHLQYSMDKIEMLKKNSLNHLEL